MSVLLQFQVLLGALKMIDRFQPIRCNVTKRDTKRRQQTLNDKKGTIWLPQSYDIIGPVDNGILYHLKEHISVEGHLSVAIEGKGSLQHLLGFISFHWR